MKNKSVGSLKRRMFVAMCLAFVPMLIIITLLFGQTMEGEQRNAAEALRYTASQISSAVEQTAVNVYNVSDAYSNDKRLIDLLEKDYTDKPLTKTGNINYIMGALFESYNRLQKQEQIDALYVTTHKELFNFADPSQDEATVLQNFERLKVDEKQKTSGFYWYPLQNNFLKSTPTNNPRQDAVVFGSRRVYSPTKSGYPYIHIFAVEEDTLYQRYKLLAESISAEVYVVDAEGNLLSASELSAVEARALPAALQPIAAAANSTPTVQRYGVERYLVCGAQSDITGWRTIVLMPMRTITQATRTLYLKIVWVVLLCLGMCGLVILYIYRRFMEPMAQLERSIAEVDRGDLQAYVDPQGTTEMVQMMQRYNAMLGSIQRNLQEKIQMETTKKNLEMQVLTSQINPHFLYNTLETIVWRANDAGRPDIGKIAASLGKLYRLSISGGIFVPLQQELDHVRAYMNIQQSRYGDEVVCHVDCDGCDPTRFSVLKLILQPVVENCFLYAMEGIDHPLQINIRVRAEAERLCIQVEDNGCGLTETQLQAVRRQIQEGTAPPADPNKRRRSTGIGLHNISARLALYAETQQGLQIYSQPGKGTRVELSLPKKEI
ncbi:MAG: histidine kinase [Gemmiger sp.]|nr:histidine kinase [Gemmiger sp.]